MTVKMVGIVPTHLLLIGSLAMVWMESIANITIPPSSVVSLLYKSANFTCEGVGDKLSWTVQGNSLTDAIIKDREISVTTTNISLGVLSSVLTIRALPINNGIIIGCIVLIRLPYLDIDEKGASFSVKG